MTVKPIFVGLTILWLHQHKKFKDLAVFYISFASGVGQLQQVLTIGEYGTLVGGSASYHLFETQQLLPAIF